jgi:hypothetical protein
MPNIVIPQITIPVPSVSTLKGYRTIIASALTAIFGALSILDWNVVLNDPKAGAAMVGMAILMAILRKITTTPVGYAAPPKPEAPSVYSYSVEAKGPGQLDYGAGGSGGRPLPGAGPEAKN